MKKNIITISREHCTGGLDIARKVAQDLNIPFYDKELITMAAKESGLSEESIAAVEKRHSASLLYSLYTMGGDLPLNDQVYIIQSHIVSQLAEKGPCVIVGRCADYILEDRDDVLNVFVHAGKDYRAKRIVLLYGETDKPPAKRLAEKDKKRALNYRHYTGRAWGDVHNYDLSLDSGRLTPEGCVEIITRVVQEKNK